MPSSATRRRTDEASRAIAAPPEAVYRAFTSAEALIAWLPPGDMTGRVLEYDFRENGQYSIELIYEGGSPPGGGKTTQTSDVTRGRFLAVEPAKLIVQTVEFDSPDPQLAGQMTLSWSFEATTTGTLVSVKAENVPPGISAEDHQAGLRGSLDNLAAFLRRSGPA
jgi:uncharacterized protein YndB with AHSA1/START domain